MYTICIQKILLFYRGFYFHLLAINTVYYVQMFKFVAQLYLLFSRVIKSEKFKDNVKTLTYQLLFLRISLIKLCKCYSMRESVHAENLIEAKGKENVQEGLRNCKIMYNQGKSEENKTHAEVIKKCDLIHAKNNFSFKHFFTHCNCIKSRHGHGFIDDSSVLRKPIQNSS